MRCGAKRVRKKEVKMVIRNDERKTWKVFGKETQGSCRISKTLLGKKL